MRKINTEQITDIIEKLCIDANYNLGEDLLTSLQNFLEKEESPLGKEVITQILQNAEIGRKEQVPVCQDTGFAIVFIEIGQEVVLSGGDLRNAVNEGIRRGYKNGLLRKSIVKNPIDRINTGDNTPAVIHTDIVPGNKLKITFDAKGGGCENMSRSAMLTPAHGREGVVNFVLETVSAAGANPCPPIIVGVGLGGTFDYSTLLAKKAILRQVGSHNRDETIASLEIELLEKINKLGIGPQGLGGRTTALSVQVETYPCHIASLPVAVNIECHSHRVKSAVI
ncbi:hydro-lyase, Fe-S type, tartrate/fumarate subfamily, alpha subunit [Candidatus Scalindua japonica]|uniref:Hydro-lyase, Fe-S type, tartrate/fumarate subfamily, alpha subunit n=1 Tax=Candidatus Scalindua japonica TaxID=1284222 RepID=A0A286TWM8_9BACT|nr:fumarate hydratase [Candidatus Scalindua japonica]GAX60297.1 hydro-lyase, Fe-S type, tartrate/fumarate subfamily, alpha subunit [Candidatus Scalindua japonica]